ncbi:hypothetical protein CHS0354_032819 [Potamilus streckersoni]|uniref:Uncharacterized protein n=1 Tax=Potamilus streckersoni TaxID=2493646 RepID=A0AAE0S935_9BIVA|nr:hypothetical protein CHS0354_032819 [Potamilus streckersoni]
MRSDLYVRKITLRDLNTRVFLRYVIQGVQPSCFVIRMTEFHPGFYHKHTYDLDSSTRYLSQNDYNFKEQNPNSCPHHAMFKEIPLFRSNSLRSHKHRNDE